MEKLSSGFRVNRAADDAAGLAISEKMRGQIGGLAQAQRNAQDGVSLVQTAEGALNEVHSMLQRVRDLRVQFGNGTLSGEDRSAILSEVKQLSTEMADIQKTTEFNGITLLQGDVDGTGAGTTADISFQVGANGSETITVKTVDLNGTSGLGDIDGLSAATGTAEFNAISLDAIDTAITKVSTIRSDYGAVQNRLEQDRKSTRLN